MNKILGINNENYIEWYTAIKKIFSFKINKLSTIGNIFNGKASGILYTGYLLISFGDIIYFEPEKNIKC